MELSVLGLILIGFIYLTLIIWLFMGIKRIPTFTFLKNNPNLSFSIIIAFRNEERNLDSLLESLAQLHYPKELYEILLVNDASSDKSVVKIEKFINLNKHLNIQLLENQRKTISPKKDAINTAIMVSQFDWILTTDADCKVSKDWLTTYAAFIIEKKAVFVAGLVSYHEKKGFIHQFQQLDWMSLIGVTLGSFGWKKPLICSGANLAYQKEAFIQVNGFEGNEHIASGDDVFLMQKMQLIYPENLFYLNAPKAMVETQSINTWRELYQQRIRWANKTSSLSSFYIKFIGLSVFFYNLALIILIFLFLTNAVPISWFVSFFLLKVFTDSLILRRVAIVLGQKINLFSWFLSSFIYPFFTVSVVFLGFLTDYNWKGRVFKK